TAHGPVRTHAGPAAARELNMHARERFINLELDGGVAWLPCLSGGGSPSLQTDQPCISGSIFTGRMSGHPCCSGRVSGKRTSTGGPHSHRVDRSRPMMTTKAKATPPSILSKAGTP